jgi:predicted transcriptional regulator
MWDINIGQLLLRYRSRYEIVASILKSCSGGVKKTKIMYGATLSYTQLKEYLPSLERSALVIHDEEKQLYKLTGKGLHFLNSFDEIDELMLERESVTLMEEIRPLAK